MSFGERLVTAGQQYGRLCVGIDPHPGLLEAWGLTQDARGVREFGLRCVEAFAGHVALVKPQVAFFERYGQAGFAALEEILAACREIGTLTVADAKRGDIGSTMSAYAAAWLEPGSPLEADSVTASPYLGVEGLQGTVDKARTHGKGVFVLAATSNPEAPPQQGALLSDGTSLAQHVVNQCAEWNTGDDVGSVGVVVGATVKNPPDLAELNGPILLPGVGAQGADDKDVARLTRGVEHYGFPNISRAVLSAGPDPRDLRRCAQEFAKLYG